MEMLLATRPRLYMREIEVIKKIITNTIGIGVWFEAIITGKNRGATQVTIHTITTLDSRPSPFAATYLPMAKHGK